MLLYELVSAADRVCTVHRQAVHGKASTRHESSQTAHCAASPRASRRVRSSPNLGVVRPLPAGNSVLGGQRPYDTEIR